MVSFVGNRVCRGRMLKGHAKVSWSAWRFPRRAPRPSAVRRPRRDRAPAVRVGRGEETRRRDVVLPSGSGPSAFFNNDLIQSEDPARQSPPRSAACITKFGTGLRLAEPMHLDPTQSVGMSWDSSLCRGSFFFQVPGEKTSSRQGTLKSGSAGFTKRYVDETVSSLPRFLHESTPSFSPFLRLQVFVGSSSKARE